MKPILFGGVVFAATALRHSIALSSAQSGVPELSIRQV